MNAGFWPVLALLAVAAQPEAPRRPQTPQPPFPYAQREVAYAYPRDGAPVTGTLTIPAGAGPHPALLLIAGSGGGDRDGTAAGHKPFLVIADHLTRRGVAVLRIDSRSGSAARDLTLDDVAGDTMASIGFLKQQREIDARRIGVLGHSLGGLTAAAVAARSEDVAFVVLLASPAVPIREFAQTQRGQRLRASGMSEDDIRKRLTASAVMYDRLVAAETRDDDAALRQELREFLTSQLPAEMRFTPAQFDAMMAQELTTLRSRSYRFLHTYDPRVTLRRIKRPVLALNGSLDQAVAAKDNLAAIEQSLRDAGTADATVVELYGLNHLFQTAKTGSPLEIAQIEETLSPKALEIMTAWIRLRVGLDK